MLKKIIKAFKQAYQEQKIRNNELLKRYKEKDYIKIDSKKQIKEIYYDSPKNTMVVVNKRHIYVSRGEHYEWERYIYNEKNDEINFVFPRHELNETDIKMYCEFPPNKKAIKKIKSKDKDDITLEDKKALEYYSSSISFIVTVILIFVIGIIIEIIK